MTGAVGPIKVQSQARVKRKCAITGEIGTQVETKIEKRAKIDNLQTKNCAKRSKKKVRKKIEGV